MMKYTSSRVDKGRRHPYTVNPLPIAIEIRKLNRKGRVSSTYEQVFEDKK